MEVDPSLPGTLTRLKELKSEIRGALVADWLADEAGFRDRLEQWLADPNPELSSATGWGFLRRAVAVAAAGAEETSVAELWRVQQEVWQTAAAADSDDAGQPITDWFDGQGQRSLQAPAGEFAVAVEGDHAVTGIYPAGHYSHRWSTKLPALLASDDLPLHGEQELWVQAFGGGQASLRYVVRDYPRDGTVYPVTRLNGSGWQWHRFDVSYWAGDLIHLELAHAQDAPLLVVPGARSWFGLRQAWLRPPGAGPPSQSDEALAAVFEAMGGQTAVAGGARAVAGSRAMGDLPSDLEESKAAFKHALWTALHDWRTDELNDAQAVFLDQALQHGLLDNRWRDLPKTASMIEEYRRLEASVKAPVRVPGLRPSVPRDQALFVRGDHRQPAQLIPRRFLSFLDPTPYPVTDNGRMSLAQDLVRADNPLTRRVIVNRLWHHLFGQGLVATPDNFGKLGSEPSHPELLDWLADHFSHDLQWSLKRMIRAMVMSETWQQDSAATKEQLERDPQNRFLSVFSIRRMEAEAIRDTLLHAAGRLDLRLYGPPEADVRHGRRAIYSPVNRNSLDPFLRVFDFPEPATSVGRRDATSVPAQSLTMLNDPLVAEAAGELAAGLGPERPQASEQERLLRLFWQCFGRPPTEEETKAAQRFLAEARDARRRLREQMATLDQQQQVLSEQLEALVEPVRQRWAADQNREPASALAPQVEALAEWTFQKGLEDQVGSADAVLRGTARLEQGGLVLDGAGYAEAGPLSQTLQAKTLEAWVKLDDLSQQGGGVLSLQTPDGNSFDSLVYGERDAGQWLAGSEIFRRTQSWEGPVETAALEEAVQVVVVYDVDGGVQAYRNGQPYGRRYRSAGPLKFEAGQSIVTMGLRHLPAGGNRLLKGRLYQARIYARALTAQEIVASFQAGMGRLTTRQILASLSEPEQELWRTWQAELQAIRQQRDALGSAGHEAAVDAEWSELAHALLMSFEMVSIR
jgi:hypothetical protein